MHTTIFFFPIANYPPKNVLLNAVEHSGHCELTTYHNHLGQEDASLQINSAFVVEGGAPQAFAHAFLYRATTRGVKFYEFGAIAGRVADVFERLNEAASNPPVMPS
jgi:hypothetical protein